MIFKTRGSEEEAPIVEMDYPYMGKFERDDGSCFVVLFFGPNDGVKLHEGGDTFYKNDPPVGHRANNWAEREFVPFYGTINITSSRQ